MRIWRSWWPTLLVVLSVMTFRSAVADWYDVPTGSMQPTIYEGERFLCNKLAYGLRLPFTGLPRSTTRPAGSSGWPASMRSVTRPPRLWATK